MVEEGGVQETELALEGVLVTGVLGLAPVAGLASSDGAAGGD